MGAKELYIEIKNKKLIIAEIIEDKDNYYLSNIEEIKLENIEIIDEALFNPSQILLHIKNYLEKNKIKKAKTTITLPEIKQKDEYRKDLIVLQVCLLVGKTDLKIKRIIGKNILKKGVNMPHKFFFAKKEVLNQLDFFKKLNPPKQKPIKSWILLTIFLTISYSLFFYGTYQEKVSELNNISDKNKKLTAMLQGLNSELKKTKELKAANQLLEKKIYKIKKSLKVANNPIDVLEQISKSIPNDCKLTKISLGKKDKTKKQSKKILQLKGIALSENSLNRFLSQLKNEPKLSKAKLTNIQKIQNGNKNSRYLFKISCKLKNI